MSDDSEQTTINDLVEQQLEFLSGGGPRPEAESEDLRGIEDAAELINVVNALVDSSPPSPPLAQDPVAIRLGLVTAPDGEPAALRSDDPITSSIREIRHRFSLDVVPAPTDGTSFERRLECRSIVENILVVVAPSEASRSAIAVHARGAFALAEDLSAVAYTDETASDSTVMTYTDCHQRLEPESGWRVGISDSEPESLLLALSRYLERSDPKWEDVQSLEASEVLSGMDLDATAVVHGVLEALASSRPRLDHKRLARDRIGHIEPNVFVGWALDVQQGRLDATGLLESIRRRIGEMA